MSNTFAGMTFTNIAQRGLEVLSKRLLGLNIFTTDFSGDVIQGTKVQTRIIPASSAPVAKSTLAYNDATILAGETTTEVEVELSRRYVAGFELTDDEMAKIGAGVMNDTKDKMIEKKVNALADEMLTYVFSLITSISYTHAFSAVAAVAADYDDLIDWRTTLAKANFPIQDTALVMNPDFIGAFLKDKTIAQLNSSGIAAVTDGAGAMVRLAGMRPYEAVSLPTNSQKLAGFACLPDCLAIAMRGLPAPDSGVPTERIEILTDPQTGATMTYYAYRDSDYRRWVHTFETYYGAKKANASNLYRIVTP